MEGVTTRLHKKFTQFQKDMEKMDTELDEKFGKIRDKLSNDIFAELKNGLEHINAKVCTIR